MVGGGCKTAVARRVRPPAIFKRLVGLLTVLLLSLRRSDGANRAVLERRLSQNRCTRRADWRTSPGRSVVSDPCGAGAPLRNRLTLAMSVAGGPLSMDCVRDAGGPQCATRCRALRADRRLSWRRRLRCQPPRPRDGAGFARLRCRGPYAPTRKRHRHIRCRGVGRPPKTSLPRH
jgi:hypothetical protein